jgi:hypothetical protein
MCLTETAIVVTTEEGRALVRLAGRDRTLLNLLVPDARPGDVVLVGMGHVLGRATPAQVIDSAAAVLVGPTAPRESPR